MKIKLLLVDDHAVVLRGLSFFLKTRQEFDVIGEAHNGKEALQKIEQLQPDLVLMDLVMPEMDGIETTAQIKQRYPHIKVLVLTNYSDKDYVLPALRAGAIGYLLKDSSPEQLVEAIRGAYYGNVQLHPDVSSHLMSDSEEHASFLNDPSYLNKEEILAELTPREIEVLQLIAKGMSNKEIAAALTIAEKTVKTHVSNLFSKLDVADRTQAALLAIKHRIISE